MFGLLKPAPYANQKVPPEQVKSTYRYWQLRSLYGMYVGYVVYYFTRKTFPFAMRAMMGDLGYTMEDLGWILTIFSLTYGLSKFTSGILSDRSNPRYFMAFGLIATGILNLFCGFASSLYLFAFFWGLNGWFQGCGWPPCSRILTHWYAHKERARWWAIWNTSHNLGGFLIPIITMALITYFHSWRIAMYLPGITAILTGFFLINRLRDTPQSLGLPPIEEFSGERASTGSEPERELSAREILVKHVLSNPFIWLLAVAYFFVYIVRQAVNDWGLLYLTDSKGYGVHFAALCIGLFEIGGLLGSLASGWLSDVAFRGKRGPVNVIFAVGVILSVFLFWRVPGGHQAMACTGMLLIGFFVFGPQMLIGIAAAELSHKKAAATATGFCGFFAYAGAAMAGGPIARVAEKMGWDPFFIAIIGCSALVSLLLLPLWSKTRREEVVIEAEADVA